MRYRAVLALALLALAALPDVSHAARILTVRDLTANPERYHGQYVTVRAFGYFSLGGHTYQLLQDEKQMHSMQDMSNEESEKNRGCLTVINRGENRNRFFLWHERTLTVSGHFYANVNWGDNYFGCGIGHVWGLEIEKVLSVKGPIFPNRNLVEHPAFTLGGDQVMTGDEPQFAKLKDALQVLLKEDYADGELFVTRFAKSPQWGFVLRAFFKESYGEFAMILWLDNNNHVQFYSGSTEDDPDCGEIGCAGIGRARPAEACRL